MLKLRVLTISVLLPLFVWLLLFASNTVFLWVTVVIISLAVFEWLKLLKLNNLVFSCLLVIFLAIIGFFIVNKKIFFNDLYYLNQMMVTACGFWLFVFCWFFLLNHNNIILQPQTKLKKFFWVIASLFYCLLALIPSWLVMNYLKIHNDYLLTLACSIVIAADIGAYIGGKLFGKHKLTIVSPGKTWEGIIGGYIGAILVAIVYLIILNTKPHLHLHVISMLGIILLTSITFIFSVVGDLFESLLKRIAMVKDSGSILPGHGGILDRIDSFCAGIPMFLYSFLFLS